MVRLSEKKAIIESIIKSRCLPGSKNGISPYHTNGVRANRLPSHNHHQQLQRNRLPHLPHPLTVSNGPSAVIEEEKESEDGGPHTNGTSTVNGSVRDEDGEEV